MKRARSSEGDGHGYKKATQVIHVIELFCPLTMVVDIKTLSHDKSE